MNTKDRFARGVLHGLGLLCVTVFAFTVLPSLESRFFPALENFKPGEVSRMGNDMLVTGSTVEKTRQCRVIQPWRGRTVVTGRQVLVNRDGANQPNWPTTGVYVTGPITITNVGVEAVELYAEHQCHPFWTVESKLGVIQ